MMKMQIGRGINYKNLKGFTLIELLAVIVILAVIALILTPIVSGIIKTAKKNAFESTGYGILESTKLYYSKKVGNLESDLTFTCNDDTCTSGEEKLEFKGNINGSGTVLLFKDGNIALCLESSDYATLKNISDERLSTIEQGTCEFDEETKEYSVNASVSAKLYEELQNQYNILNTTHLELLENYNNGKELISNAITNKGIETSSDDTFEEMAENVTNISTGDPNLRYNEETKFIQTLDSDGNWVNIYYSPTYPISTFDGLIYNAGTIYKEFSGDAFTNNPSAGYLYRNYPSNAGVVSNMITINPVPVSGFKSINFTYKCGTGSWSTSTKDISNENYNYLYVQLHSSTYAPSSGGVLGNLAVYLYDENDIYVTGTGICTNVGITCYVSKIWFGK